MSESDFSKYPNVITKNDFADIFGVRTVELTETCGKLIDSLDFRYRVLSGEERDNAFLRVIKTLQSDSLKISGPHRKEDWERGWAENLENFVKSDYNVNELLPKFVKKKELVRFDGSYIDPADSDFETSFVRVLRCYLFEKYFRDADHINEFGFGAGLNLVAASKMFPNKKLHGFDWAESSYQIAEKLAEKLNISLTGLVFDMFLPNDRINLEKDSAVFTIGTMEQLGKDFRPFTEYLIRQNPVVCINIETIHELYDQNSLFDYVAAAYLEKRNYLQGYLIFLKELEQEGRIEILEVRRTFGSFYHDGYTYIVWRPKV